MRRFIATFAICFALIFPTSFGLAQKPTYTVQDSSPPGKPTQALMQRKLEHTKAILEGLALEDFEKISRSARSLRLLSLEAGWTVVQTEGYRNQSTDFRRSCDQIANAASTKDASRAALSYIALTIRCVECHNYMRENKITLTGKLD